MKPFGHFDPKSFGLIYTITDPADLRLISNYFFYFNASACVIPSLIYGSLFLIIRCIKKIDSGSVAAVQLKADIKVTLACCLNNIVLILSNVYTNYFFGSTIWQLWAGTLLTLLLISSTNPILLFIMSPTIRRKILEIVRSPFQSSFSTVEPISLSTTRQNLESCA